MWICLSHSPYIAYSLTHSANTSFTTTCKTLTRRVYIHCWGTQWLRLLMPPFSFLLSVVSLPLSLCVCVCFVLFVIPLLYCSLFVRVHRGERDSTESGVGKFSSSSSMLMSFAFNVVFTHTRTHTQSMSRAAYTST